MITLQRDKQEYVARGPRPGVCEMASLLSCAAAASRRQTWLLVDAVIALSCALLLVSGRGCRGTGRSSPPAGPVANVRPSRLQQPPSTSNSLQQSPAVSSILQQPPTASSSLQHPPTSSNSLQQPPTASNSLQQSPTASSSLQQPPTASSSLQQPSESLVFSSSLL